MHCLYIALLVQNQRRYDNITCSNELNCIACIPLDFKVVLKLVLPWLRVSLKCDLSSADGSIK